MGKSISCVSSILWFDDRRICWKPFIQTNYLTEYDSSFNI